MAILVNRSNVAIIQGLTGKEGLKAGISMRDYGTTVVAGITPGKGGQVVEGWPVYNTVAEAMTNHSGINTTVLYVPAKAVLAAATEAITAGIGLINIITEQVPTQDTSRLISLATARGVRIVGPSSIGIISPGQGKTGSIGGFSPSRAYSPGPVGVASKSGGMCSEISQMLTHEHIGQSTVIGLGGDRISGTTFTEVLELFESDPDTKIVVIYGEIGGTYEEQAAEFLDSKRLTKPLVACISGLFAETLPTGLHLGHAGAIIEGSVGTRKSKVLALTKAGAHVVTTSDEIPSVCASLLSS